MVTRPFGLRPFVVVFALDVDTDDNETLEAFASRLMSAGCYYVCGWGSGSGHVFDSFDSVWMRDNPESLELPAGAWDETFVSHSPTGGENLDEEIWWAIFPAYSEEHYLTSVLAVASPQYAGQVERRLADSEQLSRDVVGED